LDSAVDEEYFSQMSRVLSVSADEVDSIVLRQEIDWSTLPALVLEELEPECLDDMLNAEAVPGFGDVGLILVDSDSLLQRALEFVRRLKQHERTHAIPVVVAGSNAGVGSIQNHLEAGADHYFIKSLRDDRYVKLGELIQRYAEPSS
jgi:CheY-like chemotaxis protein